MLNGKRKFRNVLSIILAAGKGERMKSNIAKVLHRIHGKPMLNYVIEAALGAGIMRNIVVVGHQSDEVRKIAVKKFHGLEFVEQRRQLGTGHAVMKTKRILNGFEGDVLVLCGDVPLIKDMTLRRLIYEHKRRDVSCTLLTCNMKNPKGYGRIIRDKDGLLEKIVEEKDATPQERKIKEVNPAVYCFDKKDLFSCIYSLKRDNKQGEYYLTDVIGIMRKKGMRIAAIKIENYLEVKGVNSVRELKEVSEIISRNSGDRKR